MARLFWVLVMLAIAGAVVTGVSWTAAYAAVATLLGAPPPQMGTQTTRLLWKGMPQQRGHPRAWQFAFAPTSIPGAPQVQIYVSLTGQVIQTYPADLDARIKAFHNRGY